VLAELVTHPEIDWVLVSLGGNDLLDGYLLGGYGDALFPIVEADVRIVIDQLLAVRPDLKIAYNGYDFPNFIHTTECILLGQLYLGGDVFFQNTLFAELTEISEDIAADYPQVTAVNLLGTLQAAGGYPNPPNFYLPSPPDFFPGDECIHPTGPGGYWNLVDRIYHGFFEPLNDDDDDDNDDNDDDDNDDDDNDNDDDNDDNNDDDNDNDDNDNDDNDNDDDDNDDNDDNDDDNDDDDNDTDGDDDSADDDDDDNNDDDAAGGLDDDQAGDGLQASEDSADGCGC
jgi:hypothetical protein